MIPQPLLWFIVGFGGFSVLCTAIIWACARTGKRYDETEPTEMDYNPSSLGKED